MLELWRGGVAQWDCDEMGHWNVRRYIARLEDGLAEMAAVLGLSSSVLHLDHAHIRFVRECRPGQALVLIGGVLHHTDDAARFYFELRHVATNTPAATFVVRATHLDPVTRRTFAWPMRTTERLGQHMVSCPAYAAPRSVNPDVPLPPASLMRANTIGLGPIHRSRVMPLESDESGHMRAEAFIGMVSDGFAALSTQWKDDPTRDHIAEGIGGAALEYRLDVHALPRIGTRTVVMSGLAAITDKTRTTGHWLLDAATGEALATLLSVSAVFDLSTRKIITATAFAQDRLQALVVPGITSA
jgi:acyl-CoA thioester hydrolase